MTACRAVDKIFIGDHTQDAKVVGRIALGLDRSSVSVAQGGDQSIAVTLTRINDSTAAVALTVDGAPDGVTATVADVGATGTTTGRVTVHAAPYARLGTYGLSIHATSDRVPATSVLLTVTVTEPPSFAVDVVSPDVTINRSGFAKLDVAVTRKNVPTPVALSLVAPAGVTATFALNPVAGDSAHFTLSVGADVFPKSYALIVRGTTPGLPDQNSYVTLTVVDAPVQLIVPREIVLPQGTDTKADVIVNRNRFPDLVTLALDDPPDGVAAAFESAGANGIVTMALSVNASATPGRRILTVRANGSSTTDAVAVAQFILDIRASGFGVRASTAALSVVQGGPAAASGLTITRSSLDAPIALSVEGAPPGVTVTMEPAKLSGPTTSAAVRVVASGSAPAGRYSIVVRASPDGFPPSVSQTVSLDVAVGAALVGSGNALLDWSRCTPPDWVAYQDGTGPWRQIVPSGGLARFTVDSDRVGVAYVEGTTAFTVRYLTRAELLADAPDRCPTLPGPKTISGTGLFTKVNEFVSYRLGGGGATANTATPRFTMSGVRDGPQDFLVWRPVLQGGLRMRILRDVNYPDGTDLGFVSVETPDSFIPITPRLVVTGSVGETVSVSSSYMTTPACVDNPLLNAIGISAVTVSYGPPDSVQRPTDFHVLTEGATSATSTRSISHVFHHLTERIDTLPPALAYPRIDRLPGEYLRLRASVTIPDTTYNRNVTFLYGDDGLRTHSVSVTPAYIGAANTFLVTPDMTGVSGWSNALALAATTTTGSMRVTVDGATPGATRCREGAVFASASRFGPF